MTGLQIRKIFIFQRGRYPENLNKLATILYKFYWKNLGPSVMAAA